MADAENIQSVYVVLRTDYEHHTDRKGRMAAPIGVFVTAAAANAAAKAHCEAQAAKAPYGEDPEHTYNETDGLYMGMCGCREDRRDNFVVKVKNMKLGDGSKSKKRKSDGGEGSAAKARKTTPTGASADAQARQPLRVIVID